LGNDLQSINSSLSGLFVYPANKNCVGQGKNGKENEVGADPIFSFWERCGKKRGNPAKEGQACESEGNGEKKELGEGVGPAEEWLIGGELVTYGGESEEVSPSMKGYKVGADGEEGGCEVEKEK
jgi:hypothetical protein